MNWPDVLTALGVIAAILIPLMVMLRSIQSENRKAHEAINRNVREQIEGVNRNNREQIEGVNRNVREQIEGVNRNVREQIEGVNRNNREQIEGVNRNLDRIYQLLSALIGRGKGGDAGS